MPGRIAIAGRGSAKPGNPRRSVAILLLSLSQSLSDVGDGRDGWEGVCGDGGGILVDVGDGRDGWERVGGDGDGMGKRELGTGRGSPFISHHRLFLHIPHRMGHQHATSIPFIPARISSAAFLYQSISAPCPSSHFPLSECMSAQFP